MTGAGVAHLRWVDQPPPVTPGDSGGRTRNADRVDHDAIAAGLRSRPGQWAHLPDLGCGYGSLIRSGSNAAYRPGGTFEATTRGGRVYARYVGTAGVR